MSQKAVVVFEGKGSGNPFSVSSTETGVSWDAPRTYGSINMGSKGSVVPFNGKYYAAFRSNDSSNALSLTTSHNGVDWISPARKFTNFSMGMSPAIAGFKGKLYIAYQENGSAHKLQLTASSDGVNWTSPAQSYAGIQIGSSPGMAAFNGKLYIAFQANDSSHALYVTSSSDGVNWVTPAKGYGGIKIGSAPAMAAFNGKLYIAFKANDDSDALYITSSSDGVNWVTPAIGYPIKISGRPSLVAYDDMLHVGYMADDGSGAFYTVSSADGTTWSTPTRQNGITLASPPDLANGFDNYVFSGAMIIAVDSATHPEVPAGCNAVAYTGPDGATVSSTYPILTCNGNTYWAYDYADGRDAMNIVMYDYSGNIVNQWSKSGAKNIWAVASDPNTRTVSFVGKGSASVSMSWDELQLTSYKLTADDLLYVAQQYGLDLSQDDANTLAATLPMVSCETCCSSNPASASQMPRQLGVEPHTASPALEAVQAWTVGALVGGLALAGAGAVVAGPFGFAIGLGIGMTLGANIGQGVALTLYTEPYPASQAEADATYIETKGIAGGPYSNGGLYGDLLHFNFPRYGKAPLAGSLGRAASGNKVQVWYPASGTKALEPLNKDLAKMNNVPWELAQYTTVYQYMFVIVKVKDEASGYQTFQIRINPEENDNVSGSVRINHSQLTEGSYWAALLGYPEMQCYGAGVIYVSDDQIVGVNTKTGHYYVSIGDQERIVIDNLNTLLGDFGYNMSNVYYFGFPGGLT